MFNVFDDRLVYLGELEGAASAQWSDYWDEIGGITLTAAMTAHNERLLQNGHFIEISFIPNAPGVEQEIPPYLILDVGLNESTHTITANGKTADYLMERRIVATPHFEDTTIPAAAQTVIQDNLRGLPIVVDRYQDDCRETELAAITLESDTLDETAFSLLRYGGYGRQLRRCGNSFAFLIDSGRDHRYVPAIPVFTSDNGSVRQSVVGDDDSMTRNVAAALLHYSGVSPALADTPDDQQPYEDGQTEMYYIGDTEATGAARRELWCGDYFQEEDEDKEAFAARVEADMRLQMQGHVRVLNLSASIRPEDYGKIFRTGDLMRASAGSYRMERRITGANWTLDRGLVRCELRLGPPTINVLHALAEPKPMSSAVAGGIGSARAAAGDAEKKVLELHYKWMDMVIAIADVSAGLSSAIENFDEFKQASSEVFAQVGKNTAGLAAIATDDVLNSLIAAKTTLYAAVNNAIGDCVQAAYLELYAVTDGQGNTKTLAELVADNIKLMGKIDILGSLSISGGNLHVDRKIYADGAVDASSFVSGSDTIQLGTRELTAQTDVAFGSSGSMRIGNNLYTPQQVTSFYDADGNPIPSLTVLCR